MKQLWRSRAQKGDTGSWMNQKEVASRKVAPPKSLEDGRELQLQCVSPGQQRKDKAKGYLSGHKSSLLLLQSVVLPQHIGIRRHDANFVTEMIVDAKIFHPRCQWASTDCSRWGFETTKGISRVSQRLRRRRSGGSTSGC